MMLFSKGRIPSLIHSEYQPSNKDESEPLSKQLLSNSMRLKQAPGVTEFSHLPREISMLSFRVKSLLPPAWHVGRSQGKMTFLRPSAMLSCPVNHYMRDREATGLCHHLDTGSNHSIYHAGM